MKNYERIKNMSVEEMAEVLYRANDDICFHNCTQDTGNKFECSLGDNLKPEHCLSCMKRWLLSEAKECSTCTHYNTPREDQPCCNCNGENYEKSEVEGE